MPTFTSTEMTVTRRSIKAWYEFRQWQTLKAWNTCKYASLKFYLEFKWKK